MKSISSKFKRTAIALFIITSTMLITLFASQRVVESRLSYQLSEQLQQNLHENLFSEESSGMSRKTDTKSMKFFMKAFNKSSSEDNIDSSNLFQLISPLKIRILKIDDVVAKDDQLIKEVGKQVVIKIYARGKRRPVHYIYDYKYNVPVISLVSMFALVMFYLFVFRRIPF